MTLQGAPATFCNHCYPLRTGWTTFASGDVSYCVRNSLSKHEVKVDARGRHGIAGECMSRRTIALQFGTYIAQVKSKRHPRLSPRSIRSGDCRAMSPRRNEELMPDGSIAPRKRNDR